MGRFHIFPNGREFFLNIIGGYVGSIGLPLNMVRYFSGKFNGGKKEEKYGRDLFFLTCTGLTARPELYFQVLLFLLHL